MQISSNSAGHKNQRIKKNQRECAHTSDDLNEDVKLQSQIELEQSQLLLNQDIQNYFAKLIPTDPSVIQLNSISTNSSASCGYCNGKKSQRLWVTSGFQCTNMNLKHYQMLMDRGWRRCGVFYYRPSISRSCCQAFTIRLDINKYKERYMHKKVNSKVQRIKPQFYNDILLNKQDDAQLVIESQRLIEFLEKQIETNELPAFVQDSFPYIKLSKIGKQYTLKSIITGQEENIIKGFAPLVEETINHFRNNILDLWQVLFDVPEDSKFKLPINEGLYENLQRLLTSVQKDFIIYECFYSLGAKYSKCNEKGAIQHSMSHGCNFIPLFYVRLKTFVNNSQEKKLQDFSLNKIFQTYIEKLIPMIIEKIGMKVQQIIGKEGQLYLQNEESHAYLKMKQLMLSYIQNQIKLKFPKIKRKDSIEMGKLKQEFQVEKRFEIEIRWVQAQFEEESFSLYKKYQLAIHKKELCTTESYKSFLCQSALQQCEIPPMNQNNVDGKVLKCGCWHMKYYLENELIAVGVIDILPTSLSSVYFFYDPDYKKYSLGVYGALQEIKYIKDLQSQGYPFFQYYYLGYYIQDSTKMVYKGDYQQSELLCPASYQWLPLDNQLRAKVNQIILDSIKNDNIFPIRINLSKHFKDQSPQHSSRDLKNKSPFKLTQCMNEQEYSDITKQISEVQDISFDEIVSALPDMEVSNLNADEFIRNYVKIKINESEYRVTDLRRNYIDYFQNLFQNYIPLIGTTLMKEFLFLTK